MMPSHQAVNKEHATHILYVCAGSGAHPASNPMGDRDFFPVGKAAGA